jgi:hypothetical protein
MSKQTKQGKIILDSGCFLPLAKPEQTYAEIGYFECAGSSPDFRVVVDNKERRFPKLRKLRQDCDARGSKCQIEVRYKDSDGTTRKDGIKMSAKFHKQLLHLRDLYEEDVPVAPDNFDCVIRFDSGRFVPADLRRRAFKEHTKRPDGTLALVPKTDPKEPRRKIMHDVEVTFTLKKDEAIELSRNDVVFWSSKGLDVKESFEIKIMADTSTTKKYLGSSFKVQRDTLWLPNPDPPPTCPAPPCPERG